MRSNDLGPVITEFRDPDYPCSFELYFVFCTEATKLNHFLLQAILGLMVSLDSRVLMENRDCRARRVVPDFRGPQVKQTLGFT